MKRSRFTEEQIIGILREQEAGAKTAEVCRRHGISGVTRGLALGLLVLAVLAPFVDLVAGELPLALAFAALGALVLALIGILGGIWAEKYDHLASVENFVIVPLAFLSGSFYDVTRVAEPWATLSLVNPLTHAVGGFRAALTGAAGTHAGLSLGVLLAASALLAAACHRALDRSPRLKP